MCVYYLWNSCWHVGYIFPTEKLMQWSAGLNDCCRLSAHGSSLSRAVSVTDLITKSVKIPSALFYQVFGTIGVFFSPQPYPSALKENPSDKQRSWKSLLVHRCQTRPPTGSQGPRAEGGGEEMTTSRNKELVRLDGEIERSREEGNGLRPFVILCC